MKHMSSKLKGEWLRGYRCHTLWEGSQQLGRIDVAEAGEGLIYKCSVGTLANEVHKLIDAKRWVNEHVVRDRIQLRLF